MQTQCTCGPNYMPTLPFTGITQLGDIYFFFFLKKYLYHLFEIKKGGGSGGGGGGRALLIPIVMLFQVFILNFS